MKDDFKLLIDYIGTHFGFDYLVMFQLKIMSIS